MKEKGLISPQEAAEMLGCNAQAVRVWCKSGECPFGCYVKASEGNRRGAYRIGRHQVEMYLGKVKALS